MRWFASLIVLILLSGGADSQAARPSPILTLGRGEIVSAAWSPDSASIWIGTTAGTWQLDANLREIAAYPDIAYAALSPDGTRLAGTSPDGHIEVWNTATGRQTSLLSARAVDSSVPLWSPNGLRFVFNGKNDPNGTPYVMMYNRTNQQEYLVDGTAAYWAWSESSQYVAGYDPDYGVWVADAVTGQTLPLENHDPNISSLNWRGDSELLGLYFGDDAFGVSTRWSIPEGSAMSESFDWCHLSCTYSPDRRFIAGADHRGLLVGDVQSAAQIYARDGKLFKKLAWSADSRRVAAAEYDFSGEPSTQAIVALDPAAESLLWRQDAAGFTPDRLLWDGSETRLLAAGFGRLILIDGQTGDILSRNEDFRDYDLAVPDTHGLRVALSDTVGDVRIVGVPDSETLPTNGFPVAQLAWQPDGNLLAVRDSRPTYGRGSVRVWNATDPASVLTLLDLSPADSTERGANGILWNLDGTTLAVSVQNVIRLYFGQTGELHIPDIGEQDEPGLHSVSAIDWFPGQPLPVVAYYACCIRGLMNLSSGERYPYIASNSIWAFDAANRLVVFEWADWGDGGGTTYLAPQLTIFTPTPHHFILEGIGAATSHAWMSPQATQVAAVNSDGDGLIWDGTTGEPLSFLANVADLQWTPDDATLAILRRDGSVWLQDADGLRLLWSPVIPIKSPGMLVWSGDGSTLAHVQDGVLRVWRP